jgi:tetratricopeptide (TPR) repeat protein
VLEELPQRAVTIRWRAPEPVKLLPSASFLPLLKAGVAAAPDQIELKLRLARILFQTDHLSEILEWLGALVGDDNAHPELLYYLGRAAIATGNDQLALDALHAAADKDFARAFGYLAEALQNLGRSNEALKAGLQGLALVPSDFKAMAVVTSVLLKQGEHARLWALCSELRARGAWGVYIPSAMALSAQTPEQEREVAALVDPHRWFSATDIDVPEEFNPRLVAELLAQKSLVSLPPTKATIGTGIRIDELEASKGPLAQELLDRIRRAVDVYAGDRQDAVDHPLNVHRPEVVMLSSWALAVGYDGCETWHVHPDGWLSGVYYVAVPQVEQSQGGNQGAIEFGPFPFGGERDDIFWSRWNVEPRAGLLLLFPSYYAHRTWPTGVSGPRVCVAFDVMPSPAQPQTQPQ